PAPSSTYDASTAVDSSARLWRDRPGGGPVAHPLDPPPAPDRRLTSRRPPVPPPAGGAQQPRAPARPTGRTPPTAGRRWPDVRPHTETIRAGPGTTERCTDRRHRERGPGRRAR